MKQRYQQFGWSLIELLIVLSIVAILTAILVSSLIQPAMIRKNNQLLLNNITALVNAAHSYRLANTDYSNLLVDTENNGILSYLNQGPNSTLWKIDSDAGTITCPQGANPSTCPLSITADGDTNQEFTLNIAAINDMGHVEGLLEQSGGTIPDDSGGDDPSSGFTVTYD